MTINTGAWRSYGRAVLFGLAILFAVGTVGHLLPATLPFMLKLTPGFLLLTGLAVLPPALAAGGRRFAWWMAGACLFTFGMEAAGVHTGAVFGAYAYGPTLGWRWLEVPLVIAFNWVLVVHGAVCVTSQMAIRFPAVGSRLAQALAAGLIAMVFDFFLEPVAIRLDYWQWTDGKIPLQNYAAWFAIAAVVAVVHPGRRSAVGEWAPAAGLAGGYVGLQALFFLLLRAGWQWLDR